MFDWRSIGIETHGRRSGGEIKVLCPQCSSERKKSNEKCLSVNLDEGVYNCHHCTWAGKADKLRYVAGDRWERPRRTYVKPQYAVANVAMEDKFLGWFERRGITAQVVQRNRIERRRAWIPALGKEEWAIAFPYFRDGEVVNVKYRDKDKNFSTVKGAEVCLYGLDDIEDNDTVIFVEGELDKLAMEVAGYPNCVSVPNGADTDLDCIAADEQRFRHVRKFILAGDADSKGEKLRDSLISRLGRDHCWIAEWPFGCKDANESLVEHGIEKMRQIIESARPLPVEGAFEINDVRTDVFGLYDNGHDVGVHPGWENLNEYYRPRLGKWTAVIAIPSAGKTAWMAALMVNLAQKHGWKFCVFPAEDLPVEEYVSILAEIYVGLPFHCGDQTRMDRDALGLALDWLQEHFVIISPGDDERNLDTMLAIGRAYCLRRGINGLVIDPFNELEQDQLPHETETQFIGRSLIKIRQCARLNNLHIWVIVHPVKLVKGKDLKYPVPTLYDASGSAHWRNKADAGISIYRDYTDDMKPVEIHVQKVRGKRWGKIGMIELYFDKLTGRYSERPNVWGEPYRDYHKEKDLRD